MSSQLCLMARQGLITILATRLCCTPRQCKRQIILPNDAKSLLLAHSSRLTMASVRPGLLDVLQAHAYTSTIASEKVTLQIGLISFEARHENLTTRCLLTAKYPYPVFISWANDTSRQLAPTYSPPPFLLETLAAPH